MKTIGIVGGLAWPSTITYYEIINSRIAERLGESGRHSADLVLVQTDFDEYERNQNAGSWDRVAELLSDSARRLEAAGADFFLIACNTVHISSDLAEQNASIPFIHIVDPTGEHLARRGFKRVGLMGSGYTIEKDYFKGRLRDKYGLEIILPEGEHKENIHRALYDELVKGIVTEETKQKFRAAAADLASRGAEAIILGCTEFDLALSPDACPVPLVDTVRLHAEAAVDMALSGLSLAD